MRLSHDTYLFRFGLPFASSVLGFPIGKHFKVFAPNAAGRVPGEWNGRADPEASEAEIERKYTPTTSDDEVGYVDLVIKVYKGGVIDRFPDGGKMSQARDTSDKLLPLSRPAPAPARGLRFLDTHRPDALPRC